VPVAYAGNIVFVHDRVLADLLPKLLEHASTLAQGVVEIAARRLEVIETLARECDVHAETAARRLATIGELAHERDLQSQAAAERLVAIEELARERDLQAGVAAERLRIIKTMTMGKAHGRGPLEDTH
jgi:hypothetical protein